MPHSTIILLAATQNLRTGSVMLELEVNDSSASYPALKIFKDISFMQKLSLSDRVRVAYWAGIAEARTQSAQVQLLKDSLPQSSRSKIKR